MVQDLRFIVELGYPWNGAALALLIIFGAIMYRRKLDPQNLRRLLVHWSVVAVALICTIGFILFYRYYGLPGSFQNGEMGFLVAPLPADTDRSKQESYVQAIATQAAQSQDLQNMKVRLLYRPLPEVLEGQHREALKLGRRLNASFVLRLVPVQGGNVAVWITRVPLPGSDGGAAGQPQAPTGHHLPSDRQIVARSCVVLALIRDRMCVRAEGELHELLASPDFADDAANFVNLLRSESSACGVQVDAAISSTSAELAARGEEFLSKGSVDNAITAFERALDLRPDALQALIDLGNSFVEKHQWKSAIAEFSRAVELKSDDPNVWNNLCSSQVGDEQYDAALVSCEKGLTIAPRHSMLLDNRGRALAGQGRSDEAIAAYRRSISVDAHYAVPHYNLSVALKDKGKTSEARKELEEAQRLDPSLRK